MKHIHKTFAKTENFNIITISAFSILWQSGSHVVLLAVKTHTKTCLV